MSYVNEEDLPFYDLESSLAWKSASPQERARLKREALVDFITARHAADWKTAPSKRAALRQNVSRAVADGVESYSDWQRWVRNVKPFDTL